MVHCVGFDVVHCIGFEFGPVPPNDPQLTCVFGGFFCIWEGDGQGVFVLCNALCMGCVLPLFTL